MTDTPSASNGQIRTREELIYALSRAAELEHGLTCIYLFTAFSMKKFLSEGISEVQRDQIRNWQSLILSVARQEMEHLGLVCNMLNAIGGPQHFDRPNLPQPAAYYGTEDDFALLPFSKKTMEIFMNFEKPASSSDVSAPVEEGSQIVPQPFRISNFHTVQELYDSILQGFINLDADPNIDLFIGPKKAQLDDEDIDVGFNNQEFGITVIKIENLDDAKQAIEEIIEQGEGIILNDCEGESDELIIKGIYQKLVLELRALMNITIDKKSWKGALKALPAKSNSIIELLKNALPYIQKHPEHKKLVEESIAIIEKQIQKINKLPATWSAKNEEKAIAYRATINQTVTYDSEPSLLAEFIEADCHYLKFWEIYKDLKTIKYEPSRNVANNPMLRIHPDTLNSKGINVVTNPYTIKVLELFNAGYETMVQMLILFFSFSGISKKERTVLMRTAFFPLMTMFTRPLGQILTQLPAFDQDPNGFDALRAGPSFEYYIDIALMPHVKPGWKYLYERLDQMATFSADIVDPPATLNQYLPDEQVEKLRSEMHFVHTNLARMAENFALGMKVKTK